MLLKEVYSSQFLENLTETIAKIDKKFDRQNFLQKTYLAKSWQQKELKQRMRAVTIALNQSLSAKNYQEKISVLKQAAVKIPHDKISRLALITFPDFVEIFGLDHFEESMEALEFFTEFATSEFAVRQFIKLDQKRALIFFTKWTKNLSPHIRRLASEGCRPRLPWGESLPDFKKNPLAILPILENLKNDESQYVRKSVANNLNDISKDHPEIVLNLLSKWKKNQAQNMQRLIKHGLRTLLKQGNKSALQLINIDCNNLSENFAIQSFALQKAVVKVSEDLKFDFVLENQAPNHKIRLEYAVYFLKQNGSLAKKIFQITTKNFTEGVFAFSKKHSFRDLSTRKHNAGKHLISLVINGVELDKKEFQLL